MKGNILGVVGAILLFVCIPQHIQLWDTLPLWYHFTFLLTLVPLSFLGGKLYRSGQATE